MINQDKSNLLLSISNNISTIFKRLSFILLIALLPAGANADVIYNNWLTNEFGSGNYNVVVTENAGDLDFTLTVDPWNAEALGVFVDLGDIDVGMDVEVTAATPMSSSVVLFATDTTSNSCSSSGGMGGGMGGGCNLGGLFPPLPAADGEWELVFTLGEQGFDGIQSFSWSVTDPDLMFSESMLGIMGIRAQQYCSGTDVNTSTADCGGSDKSYGSPVPPATVPNAGTLALIGIGLVGLSVTRRSKKSGICHT